VTANGGAGARLVRGWSIAGLDAWILENRSLRVVVVPELGGKVLELIDKAGDRDLLWHNPRTPPRRAPFGAFFDDWWCGGWDEIFPTGDVAHLHDEPLPYMGELWSVPWSAREEPAGEGAVAMTATGHATIAPARLERRLELRGDEPVLRATYRLTNLDLRPLPYLWGIHPALAISPAHRIDLPAGRMLVGVSSDGALGTPGLEYEWPLLPSAGAPEGVRDMRYVPGRDALVFGGHWATGLRDGWVALTDTLTRRGLAIAFPLEVFRAAWVWQVYGGWRGHYHLALEPWTGHPMQLDQAVASGAARVLEPGETQEAAVSFVVYGDRTSVSRVAPDGEGFVVS
jgi:galactose mutarotase-like enzyme